MTVAQRGAKYQARVKEPNGGKYHRVTFDTLSEATRWEGIAKEAIRLGKSVPNPNVKGSVTLLTLAENYAGYLWPNQRPALIDTDIRQLDRLLPADPSLFTSRDIIKFVEKRRVEGTSDATIRLNLTRLRTLLKHAHKMGDLVMPVIDWPSLKSSTSRIRYLTTEEETALLSEMTVVDHRQLAVFLIDTGLRPSEVADTMAVVAKPFEWSDVSKSTDGRTLITLWKTKTNTPRTIPLTERALDALEWSREEGHDRPFSGITYSTFKNHVVEAATRAGLKDVVVYTFRHTCASRLVQRGADVMRVKQWMGHGNIETTLGYAKLAPSDIYTLSDLL